MNKNRKKKIIKGFFECLFFICSTLWIPIVTYNSISNINSIAQAGQGFGISNSFKLLFNLKMDGITNIAFSAIAIVSMALLFYNLMSKTYIDPKNKDQAGLTKADNFIKTLLISAIKLAIGLVAYEAMSLVLHLNYINPVSFGAILVISTLISFIPDIISEYIISERISSNQSNDDLKSTTDKNQSMFSKIMEAPEKLKLSCCEYFCGQNVPAQ